MEINRKKIIVMNIYHHIIDDIYNFNIEFYSIDRTSISNIILYYSKGRLDLLKYTSSIIWPLDEFKIYNTIINDNTSTSTVSSKIIHGIDELQFKNILKNIINNKNKTTLDLDEITILKKHSN